jgi:DNA invertase Pin-like site-specific DNA recombinase
MTRSPQSALKQAIAYTRVSTKKQGRDGHGHELQAVAIEAFAQAEGYEIARTFSDTDTGMGEDSIRERAEAVAAIELSREKGWPILVDGLDRFSRNTRTVEDYVVRDGLKLISCREGIGASHAVMKSQAARAQREVELKRRNTKQALQERKKQGVLLGNRKNLDFAQKKGGEATKAAAEDRAREMEPVVRELREAGRTSARAIAEGLNLKGLRTPQGKAWTGSNVRNLLDKIAELEEARKPVEDRSNPNWGTW